MLHLQSNGTLVGHFAQLWSMVTLLHLLQMNEPVSGSLVQFWTVVLLLHLSECYKATEHRKFCSVMVHDATVTLRVIERRKSCFTVDSVVTVVVVRKM